MIEITKCIVILYIQRLMLEINFPLLLHFCWKDGWPSTVKTVPRECLGSLECKWSQGLHFSADQPAESQIPDGIVIGGSRCEEKECNVEGSGSESFKPQLDISARFRAVHQPLLIQVPPGISVEAGGMPDRTHTSRTKMGKPERRWHFQSRFWSRGLATVKK